MSGIMGSYHDFMGSCDASTEFFAVIFIVYLVSGVVPLIRAAMLRAHLQVETTWGTLIIIFLAFSFLGMGGFFIEPY